MSSIGPDYSKYSLEDLNDALFNIDKDSFPDRVKQIESEIQKKKSETFKNNLHQDQKVVINGSDPNTKKINEINIIKAIIKNKKIFFVFSVIGFLFGLTIHFSALFGYNLYDNIPITWLLHIGVFIVGVPAVLIMKQNFEFQHLSYSQMMKPKNIYKLVFKNVPMPIIFFSIFFFLYALIYFAVFLLNTPGVSGIIDGEWVIHNHGNIIKKLTANEYKQFRIHEISGMTVHLLSFYGIYSGILYPINSIENKEFSNL